MNFDIVIALGLVNWIATTIVVESHLFRRPRAWVRRRGEFATQRHHRSRHLWGELWYFVGCHLCVGTWIAFAETAVFGSPWGGIAGFLCFALLVKAVGHLILELRPQAWF